MAWEILGAFQIGSGTLKVQLSDNAGGAVSADAIRIVELIEDPDLIDNGDTVGDAVYAETGSGWSTTSDAAAYGDNYREHAAGTGENTARWTYGSLDPSQIYEVLVTWKADTDRATDASFTIYDGETATYKPTDGSLAVELSDNANGIVVADTVRLVRKATAPELIDNGQSGYGQVGAWTSTVSTGGGLRS